uniref:Single domain-containing protein n=2 Tax=Amblyomma TaxID=6942 RepID=G3MNY2_AMBMU
MCFKLRLALFALVAVAATLWNVSEAYTGQAHVEVKDGKCIFQNRTLGHHESIQLEEPCQGWFCDADAHIVSIGGCSPIALPSHCRTVDGNGTYPNCCPQVICNDEGQHAE